MQIPVYAKPIEADVAPLVGANNVRGESARPLNDGARTLAETRIAGGQDRSQVAFLI